MANLIICNISCVAKYFLLFLLEIIIYTTPSKIIFLLPACLNSNALLGILQQDHRTPHVVPKVSKAVVPISLDPAKATPQYMRKYDVIYSVNVYTIIEGCVLQVLALISIVGKKRFY
jgi:hypothetical protein